MWILNYWTFELFFFLLSECEVDRHTEFGCNWFYRGSSEEDFIYSIDLMKWNLKDKYRKIIGPSYQRILDFRLGGMLLLHIQLLTRLLSRTYIVFLTFYAKGRDKAFLFSFLVCIDFHHILENKRGRSNNIEFPTRWQKGTTLIYSLSVCNVKIGEKNHVSCWLPWNEYR